MSTTTLTVRTDTKIVKEMSAIAASYDRSRNWVIEDAMRRYIEAEKEQITGIKESVKWFEKNEGIPHELVMKELDDVLTDYDVPRYKAKNPEKKSAKKSR
jgi:predicted transcriptional regulator